MDLKLKLISLCVDSSWKQPLVEVCYCVGLLKFRCIRWILRIETDDLAHRVKQYAEKQLQQDLWIDCKLNFSDLLMRDWEIPEADKWVKFAFPEKKGGVIGSHTPKPSRSNKKSRRHPQNFQPIQPKVIIEEKPTIVLREMQITQFPQGPLMEKCENQIIPLLSKGVVKPKLEEVKIKNSKTDIMGIPVPPKPPSFPAGPVSLSSTHIASARPTFSLDVLPASGKPARPLFPEHLSMTSGAPLRPSLPPELSTRPPRPAHPPLTDIPFLSQDKGIEQKPFSPIPEVKEVKTSPVAKDAKTPSHIFTRLFRWHKTSMTQKTASMNAGLLHSEFERTYIKGFQQKRFHHSFNEYYSVFLTLESPLQISAFLAQMNLFKIDVEKSIADLTANKSLPDISAAFIEMCQKFIADYTRIVQDINDLVVFLPRLRQLGSFEIAVWQKNQVAPIFQELKDTEVKYLQVLDVIVEFRAYVFQNVKTISVEDLKFLEAYFDSIQKMKDLSRALLSDLQAMHKDHPEQILKIFLGKIFIEAYHDIVCYDRALKILCSIKDFDKFFRSFKEQLRMDNKIEMNTFTENMLKQPLDGILISTVQRLPRYTLLVNQAYETVVKEDGQPAPSSPLALALKVTRNYLHNLGQVMNAAQPLR